MLTKKEILDAVRYNSERIGKEWTLKQLPFPLNEEVGSEFVAWVCVFQAINGMKIDGRLGPRTLEAIRVPDKKDHIDSISPPKKSLIPMMGQPSNNIIINGKKVRLPQDMIDMGYTATNYLDDGEPRFKYKNRTVGVKWFVIHETVGNTADGCKKSLLKRGSGVQLIQDERGCFSCHGDLVRDRMVHANQLNNGSFGCEQVNPYSPVFVRDKSIFGNWIKKQWWTWIPGAKSVKDLLSKKGWKTVPEKYVTPTPDQIQSMKMFAPWVCEQVGLDYKFPTSAMKKGSPDIKFPDRGVVAHMDFANHADGRYMLEILINDSKR